MSNAIRPEHESSSVVSLLKAKLARLNGFLVDSYARHAKDVEQAEVLVNHLEDTVLALDKFNRQFIEEPLKSSRTENAAKQMFASNHSASLEFYGGNNQSSKKIICISRKNSEENIENEGLSEVSNLQTPNVKENKGPLEMNIRQRLLEKLKLPQRKTRNSDENKTKPIKENKNFKRQKEKTDEKINSSRCFSIRLAKS